LKSLKFDPRHPKRQRKEEVWGMGECGEREEGGRKEGEGQGNYKSGRVEISFALRGWSAVTPEKIQYG